MAELKIKADSGGGTVSLKGPATTTSNAAVQLTLPVDDGAADQYLKTDGSGVLSWATVSSDVVGDTSPQLGGDLDVNGNQIKGDDVQIHAADNQVIAKFHKTNSSEFHFNGSKKLEVNNTGIGVTGSVTPSGGLYLGGSGGSNYLDDYEKGDFEPVVRPENNTFSITMHGDTGGYYTKVGRQVYVMGCVRWTAFTVGNGSGNLLISLPFTPASRDNGDNSDDIWSLRVPVWNGNNRPTMGGTINNSANMLLFHGTMGDDTISCSNGDTGSTGMVQFSGWFRV